MKFSPANCQLQLLEDSECYSFFTFCRCKDRQILTFHSLPQNEAVENELEEKIKNVNTLKQLLSVLETIPAMGTTVKIMKIFIDNSFKQVDEKFLKELEQNFRQHQEIEFAETNKQSANLAYIF